MNTLAIGTQGLLSGVLARGTQGLITIPTTTRRRGWVRPLPPDKPRDNEDEWLMGIVVGFLTIMENDRGINR